MKTYKLFKTFPFNEFGSYALEYIDGVHPGAYVNIHTNTEYLAWIAEGNTPEKVE